MALVAVQKLIESETDKRTGNHSLVINNDGVRQYIYFQTVICEEDSMSGTFLTSNGGWNTRSTNRAIGSYVSELTRRGCRHAGHV